MYKKIIVLAVLSVCIVMIVDAQQVSRNSSKQVAGPFKLENALLWEISGNTLPQPSYLFWNDAYHLC